MGDTDSDDELPPGWEERATTEGDVYYLNHVLKKSQWYHPRSGNKKVVPKDLPRGWTQFFETGNRVMYRNEKTNFVTHTDPRLAFSEVMNDNKLHFKFDSSSTALEVLRAIDLSDKTAIVTGSNTGIGFETARSLALHDCFVIFASRSILAGNDAVGKIKDEYPEAKVQAMKLDLSSLASVKKFAQEFKKRFKSLHILILNAGIFGIPYTLTRDGYESIFQICHLSHFYLTQLLEDVIVSTEYARIVVVSSESHRVLVLVKNLRILKVKFMILGRRVRGKGSILGIMLDIFLMLYSDLTPETLDESTLSPSKDKYWSLMAYNNAKLCNLLFTFALHYRWYTKGVNVYCVHPGNLVYSDLSRHWWPYRILFALCRPFTKTLQQAASTTVFCATATMLNDVSGAYFNNCYPCEPTALVKNTEMLEKLWSLSEKMIRDKVGLEPSTTEGIKPAQRDMFYGFVYDSNK